MEVAVIIPVTRPDYFSSCMDHLIQQTYDHTKFEIIVIKRKELDLRIPITDIKIKQVIEDRLHAGLRRNLAINSTEAQILAFLDDDTVPPLDWITNAVIYLKDNNIDGVCGPIEQFQESLSLGYRLAGAANESVFLEGFEEHRIYEKKLVKFYNLALCNVVFLRKVWEGVKGFNEAASYYIDDIEFFYIAYKLGYRFEAISALGIHHAVESFPFNYLKKKFVTRFYTGINAVIFNDIYSKLPFINLTIFVYPVLILFVFLGAINKLFIIAVLIIYFILALVFSIPYLFKSKIVFILLPGVFFLTHLTDFVAFTLGIIYCLLNPHKFSEIRKERKKRLKNVGY